MISTHSMGFDMSVCLGVNLGPPGYAACPVELGAVPPPFPQIGRAHMRETMPAPSNSERVRPETAGCARIANTLIQLMRECTGGGCGSRERAPF